MPTGSDQQGAARYLEVEHAILPASRPSQRQAHVSIVISELSLKLLMAHNGEFRDLVGKFGT